MQSSARLVLHERLPAGAFSWTPPLERCLERDRSYGWAVRALHAEGPGPWSEVRIFRVGSRPSAEEVRAALSMLEEYLEQEGGSDDEALREPAGTGEEPVAGRALLSREAEGRSEQEGAPTEASVYQGDLFPPPAKPTEMVISGGDEAGARLVIEADTDNNDEGDQPSLYLAQDGGLVYGFVGFSDAENDLKIKAGASGHDNDIAFYTGGFLTPGPEERLRITSEGEIRWAPQTSFLSVGPEVFDRNAFLPLNLPDGAEVISLTAWWYDDSPDWASMGIYRADPYGGGEQMMVVTSPFEEPNVRAVTCPLACSVHKRTVIDNTRNFYYLVLGIKPSLPSPLRLTGVRVEYTSPRPH